MHDSVTFILVYSPLYEKIKLHCSITDLAAICWKIQPLLSWMQFRKQKSYFHFDTFLTPRVVLSGWITILYAIVGTTYKNASCTYAHFLHFALLIPPNIFRITQQHRDNHCSSAEKQPLRIWVQVSWITNSCLPNSNTKKNEMDFRLIRKDILQITTSGIQPRW